MYETEDIKLTAFALGDFQTNCFVLEDLEDGDCWLIDAGDRPGEMLEYVQQQELVPTKLVLTHAHADHIAGVAAVRELFPELSIYLHPSEHDWMTDTGLNLSANWGYPVVMPEATHELEHGSTLKLGPRVITVRHTPGHSPGGVVLYCAEAQMAVVGDTLFAGSVGRTDFPTSDEPALYQSVREQLFTLPDETVIFPGHGPASTIGREKATNPFFRN